MSRALLVVAIGVLIGAVTTACAETAKSTAVVSPKASGKLTPPSESSKLKPFYVGITQERKMVSAWIKELSLSEEHFAPCWGHRPQQGKSWVVIGWPKKSAATTVPRARGEPAAFVQCVEGRFESWFKKQKATDQREGLFYLVEEIAQLGNDQWPAGGERYQWPGRAASPRPDEGRDVKVYQ